MSQTSAPSRTAGILAILAASVFFTVMGAGTKLAARSASTADIVFWRSVVVAIVAGAIMRSRGVGWRIGNPGLLLVRCVFGLAAMLLFFWALGQIPLATATALLYTSPVFMVLLSGRIADEARPRGVLPLTLLAFVGGLLVVAPAEMSFELGTVAGLAAGLLAALAYLTLRNLRHTDPPSRIVFVFAVFSLLATGPFTSDHALSPTSTLMIYLAMVGLGAAGGQLLSTLAYRLERASIIGPFSYAALLMSYLAGLFVFGEYPSLLATVGIAAILTAGAGLSAVARR